MEKFAKIVGYIFIGGVLVAVAATAVTLLPFVHADQDMVARMGFGAGCVLGFVYGAKRHFA